MRKCKFEEKIRTSVEGKVSYPTKSGKGLFHQWSSDTDGPVAIIELKNGKIKIIPAESVTFIKETSTHSIYSDSNGDYRVFCSRVNTSFITGVFKPKKCDVCREDL